ncbi:MAG: yheS [Parachlamydiales bacterium]|nr:yheS [Parachlamydiales bacterium]
MFIQVEGLSLAFGDQVIFDSVTFSLQKGERCGLIGRNGSGKSTLFRVIAKQEEPDAGTVTFARGYRIGVLEQQIRFSQPTVLQEAALGLREDEKECLYKVEMILFGLGMTEEMLSAPPESLSGGYQLRIQLAKVLVSEPDCLLLDEPTNYLDIISIRFLTQLLQQWEGEMILISHDLEFLDEATTHMMGIHRQHIYKIKGKSADLFEIIAREEEVYEQTRQNIEKKRAHVQAYVERFGAKASKATQAQSKLKMIGRLPALEKLKDMYNLAFSFHEVPFHGKKMLEALHLRFSYDASPLIDDFSLMIEKKDRIAIIGKNGYGKSTILKLLTQELSPSQGNLAVSQATRIGYFGQTSIDRLHPNLKIEEEIASANHDLNMTQIRGICGLMMFSSDRAKKPISVLSGGERSRVLLGKIVAQPCNLLLLDEPTHHLDIESIEALIDAIEEFHGSVVIVTHSEWVLRRIPINKIVVCHKQKQELFLGNYDEFLSQIGWEEEKPEPKKKAPPPVKPQSNKAEIKKCEDRIVVLENSIEKHNAELAAESQTAQGEEFKRLAFQIAREQKEIDALYERLHQLYSQGTQS